MMVPNTQLTIVDRAGHQVRSTAGDHHRHWLYSAHAMTAIATGGTVNNSSTAVTVHCTCPTARVQLRKFPSPESGTKFQEEVPLFFEIP